jgi:hypothetical protein
MEKSKVLCQKCKNEFSSGKYYPSRGWLCEDCLGFKVKFPRDWVPQRIKEERKAYQKDLIQPYRQGEFSKEFKEAYPEQSKGMVESGTVSKKQYKDAKNVWD